MLVNRSRRMAREPGPPDASAAETALWLLGQGLWPVPITPLNDRRSPSPGKAPIGRSWGLRRPSPAALRQVFRRHPAAGVGLLLGPAGGVIDLEVDDPTGAGPVLERLFPRGVPETLGWRSARGEHRLFAWDERLAGVAASAVVPLAEGALELRLGGQGKQLVTICPPSLGTDGRPRTWNGVWEIAPLPTPLLRELARRKRRRQVARKRRRVSTAVLVSLDRYGATALKREVAAVRSARPGTRNRTLNRAAFSLGQIVAIGLLGRDTVEQELTEAALACGLPEREVCSTLRSGLDAGERVPRAVETRS